MRPMALALGCMIAYGQSRRLPMRWVECGLTRAARMLLLGIALCFNERDY